MSHTSRERRQALRQWARSLPKIDLHRHLEGALRLRTLADIAIEHGIDLPSYDIEQLRPYVQITNDPPDFHRFLEKFKLLRHFYTSKEAVQRVAREAVIDAAEDNIVYLELRFNPIALSRVHRFRLSDVVEWVMEAVDEVQTEVGTRTCLILQIGRNEPLAVAEEIVDLAIAYHGPLVRGVDLAGDEVHYPAHRFAHPFRRAKEAGLHITVHAGEAAGAESVRAAVELLHAERIGHGVHSVESSAVVDMLRQRGITLEICPTSNYQTGVVQGFNYHPLVDLFNLQVQVTINTDDPSISDTTLSDEYVVAVEAIGFPQRQVYRTLRYAVEAAFLPEEERPALYAAIDERLAPFEGAREVFRQELHPPSLPRRYW